MVLIKLFLIYSISLGIVIALTNIKGYNLEDQKDIYQILVFSLLVISIYTFYKKKITFEPFSLLIIITFLYFFSGGINFIDRGAFIDYNNELYLMIYLISLLFSTIITYNIASKKEISKFSLKNKYLLKIILFIGITALLLDWILMGGIPIFYGNELRANSKPLLRLFFLLGAFSSIIIYHYKKKKNILVLFFLLGTLSGYRTFVMVYFFYIMLYFFSFSKMHYRKKIYVMLIGLILFFSINLLKLYRDVDEFGIKHYIEILEKEGLTKEYMYISPILHTVREGPQIFQQLREKTKHFGYGAYFLENLSTILPGKQRGYGLIYNNIVDAPTNNTKTGTIIGAFYIDGGIPSIIFFSNILGILIGYFMKRYQYNRDNILFFIPYGYLIAYLAIWTHGGSPFSPTFFLLTTLLFLLLFLLRRKIV